MYLTIVISLLIIALGLYLHLGGNPPAPSEERTSADKLFGRFPH
jgi:hypothetical protein